MPAKEYSFIPGNKPDWMLTPEEVLRLAFEIGNPVLYRFVMMYSHDQCTWEQAMQGAVIHLARVNIEQSAELVRMISLQPCNPLAHKEGWQ